MFRASPRFLSSLKGDSQHPYNVVISGSGIVGAATLASLQLLRSRFLTENVNINVEYEADNFPVFASRLSRLLLADPISRPQYETENVMHQLRTVSLTPVSSKLLDNLGCWRRLQTKHAYYRIALRHEQINSPALSKQQQQQQQDQSSLKFFMNNLLGTNVTTSEPLLEFTDLNRPLGFITYNAEVNAALVGVVEDQKKLSDGNIIKDNLLFGSKLESINLPLHSVVDGELGSAVLRNTKSDEEKVEFSLMLGCEGRGSQLRNALSTSAFQHDYAQTGFVCTVRLEKLDDGNVCCFQNFFRDGSVIAMLPTSEDTANIIFSTTATHARTLTSASQEELVLELNNRLHAFAKRDIPRIIEVPQGIVKGKEVRAQGMFPLRLDVAMRPYAPRCLLLGDAAHGIHPFAGQGLNLGLYDVCVLVEILEKAIRSGQDIGSVCAVGQPFATEMMIHTSPMITAMEGIHAFLNIIPGVSCVGMKALQELPFLSSFGKDFITHVASGALFANRHNECFLLS